MLHVLTGSNSFMLKRTLGETIRTFVKSHGELALERYDGEEASYDRMREAIESLPFLATHKMVVLYNPGAQKVFQEKAPELLSDISETTDVVIVESKLDKRSAYYKFLKKHAAYQEFAELDTVGLTSWLVREAKVRGAELRSGDARYLVERSGASQQALAHELDKLLTYDAKITRQVIDLLVDESPQSTIFQLLDAAFSGKSSLALELYEQQRAQKVEAQQVLALVAWQLHILALVRAAGAKDHTAIAKEAKLSPFVVRKSQGMVRNLSGANLGQLISDTLALDVRLKRESVDADEVMRHFLLTVPTK